MQASVLLLAAGLAGCGCGTVDCDVCLPETLTLRFDSDSLRGGFRRAEIRSAYVVRYALNNYQQPLDTARQRRNLAFQDFEQNFGVSLSYLFAARPTPARFEQYSYRIAVPAAQRQYDVTNIQLTYQQGKGCCACSRLTRQQFDLNGTAQEADQLGAGSLVLRR